MSKEEVIKKLTAAGIKVSEGKREPKNGQYSGIVGNRRKVLELNI